MPDEILSALKQLGTREWVLIPPAFNFRISSDAGAGYAALPTPPTYSG